MPNIIVNETILLPPDMVWVDEYTWSPVSTKTDLSVTGATIFQRSKRSDGRPITLQSAMDGAWLTRSQLNDLTALEQSLPATFTLVMGDGRSFNVQFASSDSGAAIQAEPIQPGKEPADGDFFTATLKFMELSA